MAKLRILISYIILFCIGQIGSTAQESDSLFARFESRFSLLDSIIRHPERGTSRTSIRSYGCDTSYGSNNNAIADSLIGRKVEAQISAMKNITGLTINGQVYGRLDEGFGLDEEDALSRYKSKIQAELRWNFLKSSVINRKGKKNEIRIKGDIERLEYNRQELGKLVSQQKEQFHIRYDSLLCGVLKHRIANLSLLSDAQVYLLSNGGISSDDLLEILNEKAEAERMLASITRSYPPAGDISNPSGIIVSVDTLRLMESIRSYDAGTSSIELRKQLLEQQIANTTYWSTLNLSPFVRYSYYMRPNVPNSSNIDAGVSFIIPLSGETAKKRKAMRAELDILDLEKDRLTELIAANVRLVLLDIERMNRSIESEVRRLAELKGYLDIRRSAYDNRIGEYNYLSRMKEYNAYLLCCEKLLQFSYHRDCFLASLQLYLPNVSILEFCSETELQAISINPIR